MNESFNDIKFNFEPNRDISDEKIEIVAEQLALIDYVFSKDEINSVELLETLKDKYNGDDKCA